MQVPRDLKENDIKAKYDNGILLVEIPETKGEPWVSCWLARAPDGEADTSLGWAGNKGGVKVQLV